MSASRPPSPIWLTLLIPIIMLLGLPSAQAVQPTEAKLTKTLWLGGSHFNPLIAPVPKGAFTVTNINNSPCGDYSAGNAGMSPGCTSVWQTAPSIVSANTYAVAETGVQYNASSIGVRREVVTEPPVNFNRGSNNVFTGSARAHNHIVAGHVTHTFGLLSGAPSKMSKRGGARFKFDVTSIGEWELNFIVHRRGVLARTSGVINEARIGEWRPNLVVGSGITNLTHNTSAAVLAAQGSSGILVLAQQVQEVNQSTSNLQIKGKGSGSLLIDADFDMYVDAGDLLGINTLLPSSACWLGGSQMNVGNNLTSGMVDISSVLQPICKTNSAMNEAQGMEVQLVSFLADYDDDGIKDDVDNCTNVKNASQFDGNTDGTGDACDLSPPAAPTDLAVNAAGNSVTGKAQPESIVKIYSPTGSQIGTATTDSNGNFTAAISPAQVNGESLRVTATDSGGISPDAFVTAPDTIAPAAPLNAAINATGTIVTGQAQIGSTVEVRNSAGAVIGSQLVQNSGDFSITLNPAQTDGQILTVTARDLGGTSSPITLTAPDLAPPAPPTGLAVNQTGTMVTGSAEPGSTIAVLNPAGTVIGTATAGSDGSFSAPISPAQVNGELLSVTATDGGGTSLPATVAAPDAIAPSAPLDVEINAAGTVVTGKAQVGSTVEVKDPSGNVIGSQNVPASGDFSITLNPAQTDGQILPVTAKDLGGTSPAVNVTAPDLAAPAAPTNLAINGTGTIVTGKAEAGSSIEVKDPSGTVIGTGVVDNDGNFSVTISPAQTDGQLLSVTAADGGGTSQPATINAPDLAAPAAPTDLAVNATGTVVTGKAEAGSAIEVKDPAGSPIGTGAADANGDFTVTISPAQTSGQILTVTAADAGGISAPANVNAPDIDAPATPTNLVVNNTGTRMTGDAQAGSLVTIKDPNGVTIGSGQADANGKFDLALAPAQVNGELLSVTATDNAGTSLPATVLAPDTLPPAAPLQVTINAQGTIVSGQAQPGSTVEVKDPAGTVIGTVIVPTNGNFDVTLNPAQTNAEVLAVTATDLGGTSPVVNVTAPDLTPPNAPQNPIVNAAGTQVTGQAQPGATVEVKDPAGNAIGSGQADINGNFTVAISPAQTNGEVLEVTATDAGGTSPATDAQAPDSTAPTAPLQVVINAQGTIVSGEAQPGSTVEVKDPSGALIGTVTVPADGNFNVTLNPAQTNAEILAVTAKDAGGSSPVVNVTAPDLTAPNAPQNPVVNAAGTQVTGQAQPGSTVEVKDPAGNSIGSGQVDANGDFTIPINPAQTNGEVLKVTATDAGGTSPAADAQAPDSTAPDAPLNPVVNATGTQVTGKAQPGSTVEVKDPAGNSIGSGQADANGDFSVAINPAQTNGEVLKVTATDAGGTSPDVDAQAPDLTAPTAPLNVQINADGTQVTGKAEPGSTVVVNDPAGNPIGSVVVPADGNFSVALNPAQINAEILAVSATDAGGSSPVVNVTAPDLTPPNAPENVAVNGTGTQVTGQAQPGSTVVVNDPAGNPIGSVSADANGDFTVPVSPAQIDGQVLTVTATDAGGTSAPVNAQAPDVTVPDAPTGLVVAPDGSSVTGKTEPGASIEVKDPAGNVIGTGVADGNGDFTVPLNPAQTNGEVLKVTATDEGGTSDPVDAQAPDLTAPLAPTDVVVSPDGTQVTGKAQPGSTVEVKDPAGNPIGSTTAGADGSFTLPLNPAQTNGEVLEVTATDAGGTSNPTDAQAPDLTAPLAPTDVVVSADGTEVTGKAQPGSTVEVKDPAGNPVGSTTAGADGSFTLPLNPAQTNGEVLEVTATDAGGTSNPTDAQAPDLTPPLAPTDVVVSPDGTQVTGKAQPDSTVEVKDPEGNPIGSTIAGPDGSFTVPLNPAQTNGEVLEVTATDAGGTSNPTDAQAPDLPPPLAPTDLAVGANGASVTGKAEAGSTVTISDPNGNVIGTAMADANGNFYATISPAQILGQVLSVTATNAYGVSPPATVSAPNLDEALEAGVLMRAWGEFAKDKFGHALAAGDIDGDGHTDVVVGAPHFNRVIPGTAKKVKKVGRVYVYSGRTGNLMRTLDGEVKGDWFGHAVAVLDFNGDGQLDIAVGAPRAKPSPALKNSGKIYVYSGADGSLLATALGEARGQQLGSTMVSLLHDTDADLLAVAAPKAKSAAGLPGAGYISVLGYDNGTSSKAKEAYRINGELRQEQLGAVQALGPDLTGDGYAELAVGLPKANSLSASGKFGVVRVYSTEVTASNSRLIATVDGAQLPATTAGAPRKGDLFGSSVATVDDMDGDGIGELLIGAPGFDPIKGGKRVNNAGAAFVVSSSMLQSSTTQASVLASYYGEAKKDQFGWAVANGGDLQAGGEVYHFIAAKGVDVIISNPKNGKPMKANDAGALYGYKAGAVERSFKRTGNAKKAFYGNVLLAVGDVDKDGYTDVITASPFMSRYTPVNRKWVRNIGFVEVYSGEFIVNRPTP